LNSEQPEAQFLANAISNEGKAEDIFLTCRDMLKIGQAACSPVVISL
jgi:hypothetical protein